MSDRPGPVVAALDVLVEVLSDFPLATSETQSPMPWWPLLLVEVVTDPEVTVDDAELEERTAALHDDTAEVTADP